MMNRMAMVIVGLAFCATGVSAQSWEASGLIGFTPSVDLERQAPEVDNVAIGGGLTWTLQLARFFSPNWGAQVQWSRQSSSLDITADGESASLFSITAVQWHGDVVYQFGATDARVRPFAFGGLGATTFSADDLVTETKLSLGFGGGVKLFPWRAIGLLGQVRYKPTFLSDDAAGDFCDPFGFCQNTLQQFELSGGVTVRF
jgi:hypothetical protein